jgi:hypothetical protein
MTEDNESLENSECEEDPVAPLPLPENIRALLPEEIREKIIGADSIPAHLSIAPFLKDGRRGYIPMIDWAPTVIGITKEEQFQSYMNDIGEKVDISTFTSMTSQFHLYQVLVRAHRLQLVSFTPIQEGNKTILRYVINTRDFYKQCPFPTLTIDVFSTNITNTVFFGNKVDNDEEEGSNSCSSLKNVTYMASLMDAAYEFDLGVAKFITSTGDVVYFCRHVLRALARINAMDCFWYKDASIALDIGNVIMGMHQACMEKERTVTIVEGENEVVRDQEGFFMRNAYKTIVDDVKTFIDSKSLFREAGIAYRRGYLLYGPPGNGKSQLARYLFNEFKVFNLYAYYHTERRRGSSVDERLERTFAMARANAPSFLLLEDLDRIVSHNVASKEVITIDRLFNMMDGVCSPEGIILLATCNHPENLDLALLGRPGRFDRVVKIGHPDREERIAMLKSLCSCGGRFKFNSKEMQAFNTLADETEGLSMAYLKELYSRSFLKKMNNGDRSLPISPLTLLEMAGEIVEESRNVETIARRTGFRNYGFETRGED